MQNNAAAVCVLAVGVSSMDRPISSIAAKKCRQTAQSCKVEEGGHKASVGARRRGSLGAWRSGDGGGSEAQWPGGLEAWGLRGQEFWRLGCSNLPT